MPGLCRTTKVDKMSAFKKKKIQKMSKSKSTLLKNTANNDALNKPFLGPRLSR